MLAPKMIHIEGAIRLCRVGRAIGAGRIHLYDPVTELVSDDTIPANSCRPKLTQLASHRR